MNNWVADEFHHLFTEYIAPDWSYQVDNQKIWEKVHDIPDQEFWNTHLKLKLKFVEVIFV